MVIAYIIYPDVFLDALNKQINEDSIYSKLFLGELLKEKERVCTKDKKAFFGFFSEYHYKVLIETILELLNKKEISKDEINLIQTVVSSTERDGIENYPYQENITPLLDLAKDKSDTYDVKIICNNQETINKLKQHMQMYTHFGNYHVLSAKEGYFEIRE